MITIRKIYKYLISKKCMLKKAKRLGLAGLLGCASLLLPNFTHAQDTKKISVENDSPQIIATFEYESNRPEPEYNGKTFGYNVLIDGSISQADKPEVKFESLWFWDVNGDGKFGEAEKKALESGKLVYMHEDFNKLANEQLKKILNKMKLKEEKQFRGYPDFRDFDKAQPRKFVGYPYLKDFDKVEQKTNYQIEPAGEKLQKNAVHPERFAFVTEGFVGNGFKRIGIGASWEPIDKFGITGTIFTGNAKDTILSEETTEPSPRGRYGHGVTEQQGLTLKGCSLDLKIGKGLYFVVGPFAIISLELIIATSPSSSDMSSGSVMPRIFLAAHRFWYASVDPYVC